MISEPDLLVSGIVEWMDAACHGSNTGDATIAASGGTEPYAYLWSDPLGQTTVTANLAAGVYTVTVTDRNGCSATSETVTILQPDAIAVGDISKTDVSCNGGSNGSITLGTISGGYSWNSYVYTWTTNDGAIPSGQENNQNLSGLTAGIYNYSVTNDYECTPATGSVTIIEPVEITLTSVTPSISLACAEENLSFTTTGLIPSVNTTFTYTLNPGNIKGTITAMTQTDGTFTFPAETYPAGTYNFMVNTVSVNGCTIIFDMETIFTVKPTPTINAGNDQTVCADIITVKMTGYSVGGGATTGVWTGGTGSWLGDVYTPTVAEKLAGSVELTYTIIGAAPCANVSDKMIVNFNPIPTAPIVDIVDNFNGTSMLTAGNYTGDLLWSTNEISPSITVSTGGIYTVTQTLNGCTSPAGSVTVLQTPNTIIQAASQVSCGVYKVDVTVQDFTNVGAISLKLNYDPLVMAYQSADINPLIKEPIFDGNNAIGQFSFSYSGIGINLSKDAVLFTLHFSTLPTVASETNTSLTWSHVTAECEYAGPGGVPVYFSTFDDKTITVNTCSISGTLKYNNPAETPMNLVELTLSPGNAKVVTDVDGKYSFTGLHDGLYTIAVTDNKKDVGYINSTDAAIANAWVTSGGTIEYVQFLAGDVAENNLYINTNDALRIQKFFVNGLAFDKAPWVYWEKGVTINNNFSTPKPANFNVTLSGASEVGYDLYGMCTGDFNGSFTPTKTKSTSSSLMLISAGNMQVGVNQKFELLLRTGTSMELGAVSMILRIPSGLVNVQDVLVNGSPVAADWAVNGDELRIGWYSSTPVYVAENSSLLTLKLMTTETFTPGQSIDLALAFDPLNELADGNFKVINGVKLEVSHVGNLTVDITDHLDYTGLTISNYPNPFSNSTTVAYTLPVDGKVSIIVYNELEQSVMTLIDANQHAGQYTIPMNSSVLRPGIYVGKLRLSVNKVELMSIVKLNVHK